MFLPGKVFTSDTFISGNNDYTFMLYRINQRSEFYSYNQ